ncbi:hypothetical protein QQF64_005534 [Cirrhinus molitorella]|uniref:Uncharacterized protein n=1 Tax=Cirrhinus molitorella TaxID=172907 RepID=A0ABR3ME01_9TELE
MAASFAAIGLETVPPSLFYRTRFLPRRTAQRRVGLTLLVGCVHTVLMYQMAQMEISVHRGIWVGFLIISISIHLIAVLLFKKNPSWVSYREYNQNKWRGQ